MIIAVVHTNVLASGFVRPEAPPGQLLAAWLRGLFTLVVSERILLELERTFEEPYFRSRLTVAQRAKNLALLRDRAMLAELTTEIHGVATHPEDDLILAAAVSVSANYLITGDRRLHKLGLFRGIHIVGPKQFLDSLGSG